MQWMFPSVKPPRATAIAACSISHDLPSFGLPARIVSPILRTSSGEVDAIVSRNKEFVSNVQREGNAIRSDAVIAAASAREAVIPGSVSHASQASADVRAEAS